MIGAIAKLLALPVTGAPLLAGRLAELLAGQAERELLDEDGVRGDLLALQQRFDEGELSAEELERGEERLLRRLDEIRLARERGRAGRK